MTDAQNNSKDKGEAIECARVTTKHQIKSLLPGKTP